MARRFVLRVSYKGYDPDIEDLIFDLIGPAPDTGFSMITKGRELFWDFKTKTKRTAAREKLLASSLLHLEVEDLEDQD